MERQRWQQIRSIFEQAAVRPPAERDAFLDRACRGDVALRRKVLTLLAAHDDETPFLDEPLSMDALLLLSKDTEGSQVGARIGPYRLVGELGRGGMGTVYLAERADGQFEQQVAIKFVRQGRFRDDLRRRFRHEQQILASLKHPNIARLYDGGITDDGSPYLVMEYVEGVSIDQYCDRHHLPTRQRLALFRTVCEAVHYAHQNLVVHRDLKPSNILVTEEGTVKLLDFGIAKLIDEEATETPSTTRTGMRVMTPEYASPEQVRGQPITTASDVYQLGVILYELLTGHRPYEVHGLTPSAVEEVICEQNPSRPSTAVLRTVEVTTTGGIKKTVTPEAVSQARRTQPERLRRRLRGDLDNIVLKALHKDPARRYGSVAELSEDVRRHLAQLPVVARPDTLNYRISKFVRRHTVGVAATGLIILVLLGGIIATAYQARVAQNRFNDVRTLANTILFDLHDDLRDLPGATVARRTLVTHALTYLDNLNREGGGDPSLQLELAEAYEQVGEIQGDPHYTNLGDLTGAMASYQKAFALREELWQRDPTNEAVQHALANSYGRLAVVTSWSESNDQAITLSERALALLAPLAQKASDDVEVGHDLGRIRSELGWWLIWGGRIDEGLEHLEEAVRRLEDLTPRQPDNLDLHLHLWRAYSYQIDGLRFTGRYEEALHLLESKALGRLQTLAQQYPTQPRVQYGLQVCHDFIGMMWESLGDLENAVPAYQAALPMAEAMVAADSTDQKAHEALARAHHSIGRVMAKLDRLDTAVASYQSAIAIHQALFEQNPQNTELGNMLGGSQRALCRTLLDAGKLDEALAPCIDGVATQEKAVEGLANVTVQFGNLGSVYTYTARLHRAMAGRVISLEERRQLLQETLAWYDKGVATLNKVKRQYGDSYKTVAFEIHPDSLAAERDAFLRTNCKLLMANCE